MKQVDVAVVGGGIVGIAHAWMAARRGLSVVLFDRHARPAGASARNFGMVWPIGQPAGNRHAIALRSRTLWSEMAQLSGFWVNECGSIHLAHRPDERAVLEEFVDSSGGLGYDCQLLSAAEVVAKSPAVNPDALECGVWSPTELCVDPRQAIAAMLNWLPTQSRVEVELNTLVREVGAGVLTTADRRRWRASRSIIASGAELSLLFPGSLENAGLVRCKLQMLRTAAQPDGWRIGPHLAGGLTLRHYPNFADCPSLPELKNRIATKSPTLDRFGIHVMASQNHLGQVVLGDSHEYGPEITPFDKAEIDKLILAELRRLIRLPDWSIAERWHGIYAKHPNASQFTAEVEPEVHVVTGLGGSGMTMAFGLAERLWEDWS